MKEILKENGAMKFKDPTPVTGTYSVILADPPWSYGFSASTSRAIENQYPTMAVADIKALQVPAAENAVLYLWATAPKLIEALEVMQAWGFEYKTQMIWDKQILGMGYWARGQHELLLIGTKGKFSPPAQGLRVSSVYREKRGKHSKKPDYFNKLLEDMFPKETFLELFARRRYNDKWAVWGNQV
jgi:N6-adenosine-specific RNA methylase IME4